jgi:hypothetical protein
VGQKPVIKRDGLALGATAAVAIVIVLALPALLFGPFHLGGKNSAPLQAVLTYAGAVITAVVALIGVAAKWQADRRLAHEKVEQFKQIKLDAAMRAGQLFSGSGSGQADPAAMASGLLALTQLQQADLAVALLVDLWSRDEEHEEHGKRVSTETAILVIDAALRSESSNAQLVAAELLCRNATRLQPGQSLHWPSSLEGCWDPGFSHRAKLLIIEALVTMTLACRPGEAALRSAAVRLYGFWSHDSDEQVKGCIGKMIGALYPRLKALGYEDLLQGQQPVMICDLKKAADSAHTNPDRYLDQLSSKFEKELREWSVQASGLDTTPGCLAACAHDPIISYTQLPMLSVR